MAKSQNPFKILLISLLIPLSSSLFSPLDNHLISCGEKSPSLLSDNRVFLPDSDCHVARLHSSGPKISLSVPSDSSLVSPLEQTARVFTRPASYQFQIKENGFHIIRLHFYPFVSSEYDLSSGFFHVLAGEFSLLANFSTSGPDLKEFLIRVDTSKLSINFIPAKDSSFAFVNAIEVISAPKDLIGDIASLVKMDKVEKFNQLSMQAFEKVYRLNIGGPKITPFNDSLWRTWLHEGESFVKLGGHDSNTESFSGRINYLEYGASREVAPDHVYNTARVLINSNRNLSWAFHLESNNTYLVRMHFCDIVSMALNEIYFNIYLNGYLGNKNFDLSGAVGELATPYYIDYIIYTDNSGKLDITINPSNVSKPNWAQGLLNGLEIFKMNQTEKGLGGEIPIGFLLEGAVIRGIGVLFRSAICGLIFAALLVALLVLVMRRRSESRGSDLSAFDSSEGKLGREYQMVSRFEI